MLLELALWILRRVAALVAIVLAALVQTSPPPPERLILERVTVIDGTGTAPIPNRTIVIEGDRVVAVGGPNSVGTRVSGRRVDLRGKYVMPGLIDMHAHMAFGPVEISKAGGVPTGRLTFDERVGRVFARELLRWGVTTVRSPGGPTRESVAIRDAINSGAMEGPQIVTAGAVIDQVPFAGLSTVVRSAEDVVTEVDRQADAGVDLVKLYAGLPPPLVEAGIQAAHKRGLPAIGHLWLTDWKAAAEMGIDGIVHALPLSDKQLPPANRAAYIKGIAGSQVMYQWFEHADLSGPEMTAAYRALAEHRVTFDPTLVTVESIFFGDDPRLTKQPSLACVPEFMHQSWRAFLEAAGWTAEDYRRAKQQFPKALELTRRMHQAGVRITAGTDLAMPWIVPGESLHRELELLVRAGLTPLEAIAAATGSAGLALKREERIGSIAAGRRADLVILSADPSKDIRNTRSIVTVIQGGRELPRK
jgi:imidazolonepropionase-like amidohydrolase